MGGARAAIRGTPTGSCWVGVDLLPGLSCQWGGAEVDPSVKSGLRF